MARFNRGKTRSLKSKRGESEPDDKPVAPASEPDEPIDTSGLDDEQRKAVVVAELESDLRNLEALGPASRTKAAEAAKRATAHNAGRGGKRRPTEEVYRRRQATELLMREGYSGEELHRRLTELLGKSYPWNTVRVDVRRIQKQWEESDAFERPLLRARQRRKLYQVARKLERMGEWKDWIRLQELIAKIDGTETPTKVEHVKGNDFDQWTTEELEHYAQTGEAPARLYARRATQGSEASGASDGGRRENTGSKPTLH
jgi:hypothetical protein